MLRIEAKHTAVRNDPVAPRRSDGEGFIFLGVLTASWAIAITAGWAIWRVFPL